MKWQMQIIIINLFCLTLLIGCTLKEDKEYYIGDIENIIDIQYSEENVLETHINDNREIVIYESNENIYFFYFLDKELRNYHRISLDNVNNEGIWWTAGNELNGDSYVWGVVSKNEKVPVGLDNHNMEFLQLEFGDYTIFYIVTEEKLNSPIEFNY